MTGTGRRNLRSEALQQQQRQQQQPAHTCECLGPRDPILLLALEAGGRVGAMAVTEVIFGVGRSVGRRGSERARPRSTYPFPSWYRLRIEGLPRHAEGAACRTADSTRLPVFAGQKHYQSCHHGSPLGRSVGRGSLSLRTTSWIARKWRQRVAPFWVLC